MTNEAVKELSNEDIKALGEERFLDLVCSIPHRHQLKEGEAGRDDECIRYGRLNILRYRMAVHRTKSGQLYVRVFP